MTEARARLVVQFRTKKQAMAAAEALKPEAAHPAGRRGLAIIATNGNQLSVCLDARDSPSLRAIVTSYLRMLAAIVNVLSELEQPRASRK